MHRNTPLFVLVLCVFVALVGLILWADQDCGVLGASLVCSRPYGDLGTFLALAGTIAVLVAMVLEIFVGLRQKPPQDLPVPITCRVCGDVLVYFHDYGLWYCPACGEYSGPKATPLRGDLPPKT